jgi:hypothetical protein
MDVLVIGNFIIEKKSSTELSEAVGETLTNRAI